MPTDPQGSAAPDMDHGPDWHIHTRGFGPTGGHRHRNGEQPHDHDLDGLSWGPPQFFTPDGAE